MRLTRAQADLLYRIYAAESFKWDHPTGRPTLTPEVARRVAQADTRERRRAISARDFEQLAELGLIEMKDRGDGRQRTNFTTEAGRAWMRADLQKDSQP